MKLYIQLSCILWLSMFSVDIYATHRGLRRIIIYYERPVVMLVIHFPRKDGLVRNQVFLSSSIYRALPRSLRGVRRNEGIIRHGPIAVAAGDFILIERKQRGKNLTFNIFQVKALVNLFVNLVLQVSEHIFAKVQCFSQDKIN